jgi:DNA-binding transcriptional ArsR family regulator
MKPYLDITDPSLARALAHPLRARILVELEDRTASPSEIADELGAPLGVVSYHVRRLAALKLLKLVKRVPRRGAVEHYYTATTRPRVTERAWRSMPSAIRHAALGTAIAELGDDVSAAAGVGGFDRAEAHLVRSPLTVDDKGWKDLAAELDALQTRAQEIQRESKARLAGSDGPAEQDAEVVLMLFAPAQRSSPASRPRGG